MRNSNAVFRISFTSSFITRVSQNDSATISFKAKKINKKYISLSPVSSWLLPISFLPIIFICPLPHQLFTSAARSPRNVPCGSRPSLHSSLRRIDSFDGLAQLYKNIPLFLFKWGRPWRGTSVRINAQISTISPQLHVCQTLCRGEITLRSEARRLSFFFFFFPVCRGCMVKKIDLYMRVGGRNPQRPAFGLRVAGIHRDEPDGGHLGQWALKANRHGVHFTMSSKIVQSVTTYQLLHINAWINDVVCHRLAVLAIMLMTVIFCGFSGHF